MTKKEIKLIISYQVKSKKYLLWLGSSFTSKLTQQDRTHASDLIDIFVNIGKTRGLLYMIKFVKETRTAWLAYLGGKRVQVTGVALTRSGCPKILLPLLGKRKVVELPSDLLRLIHTVLYSTRMISFPKQVDTSPITDSSLNERTFSDEEKYVKLFWKCLGYRQAAKVIPSKLWWKKFHLTTNSGPSGHALWTSLNELLIVYPTLGPILEGFGGKLFTKVIRGLYTVVGTLLLFQGSGEPSKSIRRLTYFPDKEDKVRVVAILDYWTQTVLKPFHYYLFQILKKIPQDCTFAQGKHILSLKGETFYSIDLSNATDRFPIELICTVLKGRLPSWYIDSWRYLMTGLPFDFKSEGKVSQLYYSVGNPMGAYSSWSSFAVAHHFVVFYCCCKCNKEWSNLQYALLGDDIVIADKEVAECYMAYLASIGVTYSSSKTHQSPYLYEFAKRLIYKGTEVSPFPFSALIEGGNRLWAITNLLLEQEARGWIPKDSILESVRRYYGQVLTLPSRWWTKRKEQVVVCEHMMHIMRGTETAEVGLNSIFRYLGHPNPTYTNEVCNNILSNVAVELFAESNDTEKETKYSLTTKPLGLLAENYLIFLTSLDLSNGVQDLDFEYHFIPVLNVYGQIEQLYRDIQSNARRIDTLGGDWPLFLRTLTVPLSDEIFFRRSSHLIPSASIRFVPKLKERMELLLLYPNL